MTNSVGKLIIIMPFEGILGLRFEIWNKYEVKAVPTTLGLAEIVRVDYAFNKLTVKSKRIISLNAYFFIFYFLNKLLYLILIIFHF